MKSSYFGLTAYYLLLFMAILEINNEVKKRIPRKTLNDAFRQFIIISHLSLQSHASLAFVDEKTIKKLNAYYRKKNKPTDVLSFSEFDKDRRLRMDPNYLGEIVICYDVARKQSVKTHQSVMKEIQVLFIHGLAHIIGYDHKTKKQERVMQRFEKKLLPKL